jgi:hypothetical protein
MVEAWIKEMPVPENPRQIRIPNNATWREQRHVIRWMNGYVEVECDFLLRSFINDNNTFEVVVFTSKKASELDIRFRLTSAKLDGYTEYGIACHRVGESDYICVE